MRHYYPTNVVRADETFRQTNVTPKMSAWGVNLLYRRVSWATEEYRFRSHVLFWVIRWYHGTGKVDASQTYRLRSEQVDYANGYVVATTPKEMASFRLSLKRPDRERWDNMGGI